MWTLLQAVTPVMDIDLILKVGGVLAAVAAGWGVMQQSSRTQAKRLDAFDQKLDTTIIPTLNQIGRQAEAGTRLAEEALRQAQAGHQRLDGHTMSIQEIEVKQARLEERLAYSTGRRTAKIHPEEPEG